MMTLGKILLLVALIGYSSASPTVNDHAQGEPARCLNKAGCGSNECCVTMPNGFVTAFCSPLRQMGQPCVPNPQQINSTLTVGGNQRTITDVFWVICPCAGTLTCNSNTGLCDTESNTSETENDNLM